MANTRVKVPPFRELELMAQELLLSETSLVTKVSPQAVVKGVTAAHGKLAQKVLVEAAVIDAKIFTDTASGDELDDILERRGLPARFGATKASTYVRLVGSSGTVYQAGVHYFQGKDGLSFELLDDATIPDTGFVYAYVRALTSGVEGNVDPITLNTVTPTAPVGHEYVINEYAATGGQGEETDEQIRVRIKNSWNILAQGTQAKYEQILAYLDSSITNQFLKLYNAGVDTATDKLAFRLATVNGGTYSAGELTQLEQGIEDYLEFGDQLRGVVFSNVTYYPIDISLRVDLDAGADADETRKRIQINMGKLLDPLVWDDEARIVEWDDFLQVAKNDQGINKVYDQFFTPSTDQTVPLNQLPKIRGFVLYDVNGNILSDTAGVLNSTYYPLTQDEVFQQTITA